MSNAIEIRGLCKHYTDFTLEQLDLTVPYGSIVGLVGENGAGKTTTLKALLGAIRPDSGTIQLLDGHASDTKVRSRIGLVFEDSFFYETCTPEQVGKVLAKIHSHWDAQHYSSLLQHFELSPKKAIKDMSRGMRMKARLAAAMGHNPQLLILDEPTSGLDPVARQEFLEILQDFILDGQNSVLMSSHITSDLEKVADEIAYLHKGRLEFQMEKDALLEHFRILRCSAAQMDTLPPELILHRQQSAYSCAALVQDPKRVKALLPHAVLDGAGIDEIMQFYSGRDAK